MFLGFDSTWKPQTDGSYSIHQIHRFIYDLVDEPRWRQNAAVEASYYDGNQLRQETLQRMRDLGIPPIIVNLIQPALNSVFGMEVAYRRDPAFIAETDASVEMALAMNAKLKVAQRRSSFDRALSDGFESQCKIGIGWAHVGRNPDPFAYPYRCQNVPWREMFWDWRARESDLSDARFICRRRWVDGDALATHFPGKEELIKAVSEGWPQEVFWDWRYIGLESSQARSDMSRSWEIEQTFTLEESEWRELGRHRVQLYEILYWVPKRVMVMALPDDRKVQFDRKNPRHIAAVSTGQVELVEGPTKQWRQAYYVGPHRLSDIALATNEPHYIPLIAYREDGDGSVYGIIRAQKSAQEGYNARHSRELYNLSSRRYAIDEDAVDDLDEARHELGRVDTMLVLKKDRRREAPFQELGNHESSAINFQLMQEYKGNVDEATGIHPEFKGRSSSAGQSGVAIEELVFNSQKAMGPILENYLEGRERCGKRLGELIYLDALRYDNQSVEWEEDEFGMGKRRTVILNARAEDGARTNDLGMFRARVALGEAPRTTAYLQQKFQALTEMVKSFPPEIQLPLLPLIVQASQVPDRKAILNAIREVTGVGPEPTDPQEKQAWMESKQRQQEIEMRLQEIEMLEREAQAEKVKAEAKLTEAKAVKLAGPDTDHTEAKTMHELAKVGLGQQAAEVKAVDQDARMIETQAKLEGQALDAAREERETRARKPGNGGNKR